MSDMLDESIARWAKKYSQITRDALKSVISNEITKPRGTSLPALTAAIDKIPKIHANKSAEMIAKTISFDAINSVNRAAWQQSGVVKTLKWYTAEDDDVCKFCKRMNGKVIDIHATFVNAGDVIGGVDGGTMAFDHNVENPLLHLGCRCYCRPDKISID